MLNDLLIARPSLTEAQARAIQHLLETLRCWISGAGRVDLDEIYEIRGAARTGYDGQVAGAAFPVSASQVASGFSRA
jgi:hypothetical protein